jgi:ornithine cyclodeaminase/alanine dehydrogenase-like protein (mu-crystallin family)
MAFFLTEAQVSGLLAMPEALEAVERAFAAEGRAEAFNQPRQRLYLPDGVFHIMSAAVLNEGVFGFKAYASFAPKTRFLFFLYDADNGNLLCVMEADRLGQIRTGAASGVATRYMARHDARTLGIIGAGWQAETQVEAICAVRPIARVKVFSRHPERREQFAERMSQRLSISVVAADTAEEAARGSAIVVCATTAREPVLFGEWLDDGTHINAIGANAVSRRELDSSVLARCHTVAVDDRDQARIESGELLTAIEARKLNWRQVHELADIVAGRIPGRSDPAEVTLFKSLGVALEDVAVAHVVYRKALAQGVGQSLPF